MQKMQPATHTQSERTADGETPYWLADGDDSLHLVPVSPSAGVVQCSALHRVSVMVTPPHWLHPSILHPATLHTTHNTHMTTCRGDITDTQQIQHTAVIHCDNIKPRHCSCVVVLWDTSPSVCCAVPSSSSCVRCGCGDALPLAGRGPAPRQAQHPRPPIGPQHPIPPSIRRLLLVSILPPQGHKIFCNL